MVNLRTGREGSPRPAPRPAGRTLVVGGGPAGIAAALAAARAGDEVALVERDEAVGGQLRLAGHVPAHAETWARYRRRPERDLARAGVEVRLGEEATAATPTARPRRRRDRRPALPAGAARPALPRRRRVEAIAEPDSVEGPVLVADWGGESGPRRGRAGRAAGGCRSSWPRPRGAGRDIHQYQRNLYLARLDLLGVACARTWSSTSDGRLRHVFTGRTEPIGEVATLVLAQGRPPEDALWRSSRAGRASSGRATCSARARSRRRSWKARSPCGRFVIGRMGLFGRGRKMPWRCRADVRGRRRPAASSAATTCWSDGARR